MNDIPQVGFSAIPDDLFDMILRTDFTKRQLLIIMAVIRQTYGEQQGRATISAKAMSEMISVDERNCRRTVAQLVSAGVLTSEPTQSGKTLGLVEDFEQWNIG